MRSQGVADTQLGEPGWHRRAKLSSAGSAMPLLTLCEPGFSTRVGVSKPVGASVAACCCHRYRRRDTRITHSENSRPYFPAMTMAASPRQIDRSRSRSGRPRQAARYSPKFALPFKLTGSTFSNGAILRLPADCRTIRNRKPRPLVRRSPTKRRGTSN
jgi:hypothetical protein